MKHKFKLRIMIWLLHHMKNICIMLSVSFGLSRYTIKMLRMIAIDIDFITTDVKERLNGTSLYNK